MDLKISSSPPRVLAVDRRARPVVSGRFWATLCQCPHHVKRAFLGGATATMLSRKREPPQSLATRAVSEGLALRSRLDRHHGFKAALLRFREITLQPYPENMQTWGQGCQGVVSGANVDMYSIHGVLLGRYFKKTKQMN